MTGHRIIAAPWQIEAASQNRLKAVIAPLNQGTTTPYPTAKEFVIETTHGCYSDSGWCFNSARETFAEALDYIKIWNDMRVCSNTGAVLYDPNYFLSGDRLFLAEEWFNCLVSHDAWGDTEPVTRSSEPDYMHQYQPAETMPEEAAVHWYEVELVRVCQANDITRQEAAFAGLIGSTGDSSLAAALVRAGQLKQRWNAAWPEYPWHGDRWVVVLGIKEVENA